MVYQLYRREEGAQGEECPTSISRIKVQFGKTITCPGILGKESFLSGFSARKDDCKTRAENH